MTTTPVGAQTMSPAMAHMAAYPAYLYRLVRHALGQRVLEIGVGYGTYTTLCRQDGRTVLATDIDPACTNAVAARFAGDPAVSTAFIDLTAPETIRRLAPFQADSILCFNVLEHIEQDVTALNWLREAVIPGARLALIVPAMPSLFGRMDVEAGHFRRYTCRSARSALQAAGWKPERIHYANLLGAAGWWYHNRWRKHAGLADPTVNQQMASVDRWLPRVARVTDPLFGQLAGLSVVAIARA